MELLALHEVGLLSQGRRLAPSLSCPDEPLRSFSLSTDCRSLRDTTLDFLTANENIAGTCIEVRMNRTEDVVERALAAVAASKACRERHERQREAAYSRIQIAMLKKPVIPKGMQILLELH